MSIPYHAGRTRAERGGQRGREAGGGAELGRGGLRGGAVRVAGAQPRAAGWGAVGRGGRVAGVERMQAGDDCVGDGQRRLRYAERLFIECHGE